MKHPRHAIRSGFPTLLAVLLFLAPDLPAGRPGPPHRSPPGRRQANMIMLRFQDALAADRWQEALSFCSERVRTNAAAWPSLKDFFTGTMPLESVLSHDFGCWSCGDNFYGMFVQLYNVDMSPAKADTSPFMQWYWAVAHTDAGWVIDYPPVKMDDYIARRKAAIQEREDRIAQIRRDLEPKVKAVKTRLRAMSEDAFGNRFVLGSQMPFRLELVNTSPTPVHYTDSGVRFLGLTITDDKHEPVPFNAPPSQIMVKRGELAPGATVVIADALDINQYRAITKPGKYTVQFNSALVQIGQPMHSQETGRFGENLSVSTFDFLSATNTFPSNHIEIEVLP